jgi:hypothetical protein
MTADSELVWTQRTASADNIPSEGNTPTTGRSTRDLFRQTAGKIVLCLSPGVFTAAEPPLLSETAEAGRPSMALSANGRLPQEQQDRLDRLFGHLKTLVSEAGGCVISKATVKHVKSVWEQARASVGSTLTVPSAANGPDEEVLLRWTSGEHLLEVNVYPTGKAEWFYWNRSTDESCEQSAASGDQLPAEAASKLRLIASLKASSRQVGSASLPH